MQNWKKLGLVYNKKNYNAVPIVHFLEEDIVRIYATSRNENNKSFPFFIEYNLKTKTILKEKNIDIPLGKIGTFDEDGIMPACVFSPKGKEDEIWMYYAGWNLAKSVPFRNSLGLAISKDKGITFTKYAEAPLLDRSLYDKCFVSHNCIFQENDFYRTYYISCDKWEERNGVISHSYNIKYAESKDAIHWVREGKVAINFRYENEYAISVPRVIKEDKIYKMWYSYRGGPKGDTYRIGYAESLNGVDWIRKDEEVSLDVSKQGWDSDMICYPFVFDYKAERYMFYNGNGYGKSGFGLAVLEK